MASEYLNNGSQKTCQLRVHERNWWGFLFSPEMFTGLSCFLCCGEFHVGCTEDIVREMVFLWLGKPFSFSFLYTSSTVCLNNYVLFPMDGGRDPRFGNARQLLIV